VNNKMSDEKAIRELVAVPEGVADSYVREMDVDPLTAVIESDGLVYIARADDLVLNDDVITTGSVSLTCVKPGPRSVHDEVWSISTLDASRNEGRDSTTIFNDRGTRIYKLDLADVVDEKRLDVPKSGVLADLFSSLEGKLADFASGSGTEDLPEGRIRSEKFYLLGKFAYQSGRNLTNCDVGATDVHYDDETGRIVGNLVVRETSQFKAGLWSSGRQELDSEWGLGDYAEGVCLATYGGASPDYSRAFLQSLLDNGMANEGNTDAVEQILVELDRSLGSEVLYDHVLGGELSDMLEQGPAGEVSFATEYETREATPDESLLPDGTVIARAPTGVEIRYLPPACGVAIAHFPTGRLEVVPLYDTGRVATPIYDKTSGDSE